VWYDVYFQKVFGCTAHFMALYNRLLMANDYDNHYQPQTAAGQSTGTRVRTYPPVSACGDQALSQLKSGQFLQSLHAGCHAQLDLGKGLSTSENAGNFAGSGTHFYLGTQQVWTSMLARCLHPPAGFSKDIQIESATPDLAAVPPELRPLLAECYAIYSLLTPLAIRPILSQVLQVEWALR